MAIDYKSAGVDIEAGDELVAWLKTQDSAHSPHRDRIVSGIGGFAALFNAQFDGMKEPCLVACTDGVGTKVKLATEFSGERAVAQDMVAMCVNDLVCSGAQPLFFLDYYACGALKLDKAKEFLSGVRAACDASQCALIGGETAEMPGVYAKGDFDCAGFAVGVVDREKQLGALKVKAGDFIWALPSSGFHSNGYSLLRKVFEPDLSEWAEELLKPTRLYVEEVMKLCREDLLSACAHITGGGLDNILRVLPEGCSAELEPWQWPAPFLEVQKRSGLTDQQMLQTLNCGVGMALFVPESKQEYFKEFMLKELLEAWQMGRVVEKGSSAQWFWRSSSV